MVMHRLDRDWSDVWIIQGETIWQVFERSRFLGNSRADPCSRKLKREPSRAWVEANCAQGETVLYLGYDWTEMHRVEAAMKHWVEVCGVGPWLHEPKE